MFEQVRYTSCMSPTPNPVVPPTNHALPDDPIDSLERYLDAGGLEGLGRARHLTSPEVIDIIGAAGIRGRGGAGFPAGRKWRSLAEAIGDTDRAFVVINAAEGEPGTFKDRALLRRNPYLVLEGALIAAHCLDATRIVVATKARYHQELDRVRTAISELTAVGVLGNIEIEVVEGPDHYLFGEESALLEVIEGEDPLPRQLPPYLYGLFTAQPNLGWSAGSDQSPGGPIEASDNPALVNNVETYAHAALVCRHGAEWYRSMGTSESPGPTVVTITGDVQRPVVAEIPLGQPLRTVIHELAGGPGPGRLIKGVLSGVSNPVITPDLLDLPITHEHFGGAGTGVGSAGFIVYDDTRNMVDVAYQVSRFLHVESCGQCNPCKTGTQGITQALESLVLGTATSADIDLIERRILTVTDGSRCYLPTQEQRVVMSLLQQYPADLDVRLAGFSGDLDAPLPKLIDVADGVATTDPTAGFKRPDWTYGETPVRLTAG